MTESHIASCSCGQLVLTFTGERPASSICHCFECQKRTGSAFGLQVRLPRASAHITGTANIWSRVGDGGASIDFHFCPMCASTLYWGVEGLDESWIVAVGAFEDPTYPAPTFAVYEARQHDWFARPASVKQFMD